MACGAIEGISGLLQKGLCGLRRQKGDDGEHIGGDMTSSTSSMAFVGLFDTPRCLPP
jgi:hypothetical protein